MIFIMNIRVWLFVFFLGISSSLLGQWQKVNTGFSNDFYDIQYINSNTIILCNWDGIIRTDDGGNTWVNYPIVREGTNDTLRTSSLEDIHFYDENIGIAIGLFNIGGSVAVLRTVNGGKSWTIPYIEGNGFSTAQYYDIDNFGDTLFVVGNGKAAKSTDKGLTWGSIWDLRYSFNRGVAMSNKNTVYVAANELIYKSIDQGASWIPTQFKDSEFFSIRFRNDSLGMATSSKGLWTTEDGGVTWSLNQGLPLGVSHYGQRKIFFGANADVYIAAGYIYKSDDNGKTWSIENLPLSDYYDVVFLDANNGIVVSDSDKVWSTSNGGQTIPISKISEENSIYCPDSISKFTAFKTKTNYYHWYVNDSLVFSGDTLEYVFKEGGVSSELKLVVDNGIFTDTSSVNVSIEDGIPKNSVASLLTDTACYGYKATVKVDSSHLNSTYELNLNGSTISSQIGNGGSLFLETGNLFSSTALSLFVTHENSCGKRIDTLIFPVHVLAGQVIPSWNVAAANRPIKSVYDIDFISPNVGYAVIQYANDFYKILKTSDKGENWTAKYIEKYGGDGGTHLFCIDEQLSYIGGSTGMKATSDFNVIEPLATSFNSSPDFYFVNRDTGFAISTIDELIDRTTDQGATWTKVHHRSGSNYIKNIDCPSSNVCYAALELGVAERNDGMVDSILVSYDLGLTWQGLPVHSLDSTGFSSIDFVNDTIGYGGKGGNIYKTIDGGRTWKMQHHYGATSNSRERAKIIALNEEFVYVLNRNELYRTLNAGECWENILPSGVLYSAYSFDVTDDGRVVVVGRNQDRSGKIVWTEGPSIVTSVSDQNLVGAKKTLIFPNPANDQITVKTKLDNFSVAVYNVYGEKVLQRVFWGNIQTIDISNLASGVYILRIDGEFEDENHKFYKN